AHTRYTVLETFRQFGAVLLSHEERMRLRDCHLAHYLRSAREAQRDVEARHFARGRRTFAREWDNVRAMEYHAIACRDGDALSRVHRALRILTLGDRNVEVGTWAQAALAAGVRVPMTCYAAAS